MKTKMEIRPFQAADYDMAASLWREVFPHNRDLSDSRAYVCVFLHRNPGLSFVAVAGGRVVGAVLAGHDSRRGYVYHLGVLPAFRNIGIGAALLGEVEKALAAAGIVKLHLFVWQDNRGACDFYRRRGYQRREDIAVFSKILQPSSPPWTVEDLRLTEVGAATAIIERVFDEFIGPGYAPEGVDTFKSFIQPAEIAWRSLNGNFILVAKDENEIIGVIEMKNYKHISLLFVAKEYHRQGVAKQLLRQAVSRCRTAEWEELELTVNSSPFAVPVYQKLGFTPVGPEQVQNGIRFVPMILKRM